MGHDIVFLDEKGEQVEIKSTKWLRDYAPRDISYYCDYFLKDILTTNDLDNYRILLRDYIEDMKLDYPVFPADELLALQFNDSVTSLEFQKTLAKVLVMIDEKADYPCMEKELEKLSELIQAEEEERSSWADEATVKFWEFSESLERGLYMMSEKHQVWIEVELYESIQKFIKTLEEAVRKGWTAEWSY